MSISRPTTQPPPISPPQPQPPPPLSQPPQTPRYDLELTIISGKHLKNVNWKNGGSLKPYAIFWVDPDHKITTKSDDSSDTKPVWNQRFTLPIPTTSPPLHDAVFTLEVFHSRASETPKPFVGSLQVPLSTLPEPENGSKIRTYDLLRPCGRPHGKIKLKLDLKPQQSFLTATHHTGLDYQNTLPNSYYYSSAPPQPQQPTSGYPYSMGYYAGYYPPPPPVPTVMRSFSERNLSYGAAPSAPVDYSPYEVRFNRPTAGPDGVRSNRPAVGAGFGAGLGVGALGGMMGGLALDEEKVGGVAAAERVEDNYLGGAGGASSVKDDYSEYRAEY